MSQERRYLFFALVQYVHDRREERLNVGVVVHDPERGELRAQFDPGPATRRVKAMFPDVDRKGLELYLADLGSSLVQDARVTQAAGEGRPLEFLADTWRNVIRFSAPRAYPARDVRHACEQLIRRYVAPPVAVPSHEELRGVERARTRTREALRSVLHLVEDVGFRPFSYDRPVVRGNRVYKVPLEFPFLVLDRFVIDTLSFEGQGVKEHLREASFFVEKVKDLRRYADELQACASVAVDPDRQDLGRGLIADILDKTGLPESAVVEADDAETMARYIGAHVPAAA